MSTIKKYDFPLPNKTDIYNFNLFPKDLEDDKLILFHGTSQKNFHSILDNGFKAVAPLESVSYAFESRSCLSHVCGKRPQNNSENDVVFAVRFETLDDKKIVRNSSDIHVYSSTIRPKILGYCVVPFDYKHI